MIGRELDLIFDRLEATTGPYGRRGRDMILTCLETPTIETWDDVHSFVLVRNPFINFMDAVQAVDPNYEIPPRKQAIDGCWLRNWDYPPNKRVLIEALRFAAFGRQMR